MHILPHLGAKMIAISARNTKVYKFASFARLYFPHLQHFATKHCNFTNFSNVLARCVDLFASPCLVLN
jgi:hypothetical protein